MSWAAMNNFSATMETVGVSKSKLVGSSSSSSSSSSSWTSSLQQRLIIVNCCLNYIIMMFYKSRKSCFNCCPWSSRQAPTLLQQSKRSNWMKYENILKKEKRSFLKRIFTRTTWKTWTTTSTCESVRHGRSTWQRHKQSSGRQACSSHKDTSNCLEKSDENK